MKTINVLVRDKIASAVGDIVYICGNSDYVVSFDFDAEWGAYGVKTARFVHNGTYTDVVFTGNQCAMPVIHKAYGIFVGVYAGNLRTTTPAHIPSAASILSAEGTPAEPPDDVYAQLMELLSSATGTQPATPDKLGAIKVGRNLEVDKDGVLSVATTNEAEEDNTKPITSAGVYTQLGNIESLLAAL